MSWLFRKPYLFADSREQGFPKCDPRTTGGPRRAIRWSAACYQVVRGVLAGGSRTTSEHLLTLENTLHFKQIKLIIRFICYKYYLLSTARKRI